MTISQAEKLITAARPVKYAKIILPMMEGIDSRMVLVRYSISVSHTMDRSRYPSSSVDEVSAGRLVYFHNRCITEKTAEFYLIAYALAGYRNNSYGCSLVIESTKCHLISNDTGDSLG